MSDYAYKNSQFAFLAHPPPLSHKKRAAPTAPLPPTPPHKFATILTWAATVQPGSPAPLSPNSPRRRLSISSTASPRRRRPSVASILSLTQAQSTGAAARSPSVADKFDLTALGYTSVFVHLPKTPTTPSPLLRAYDLKHRTPAPAPTSQPAPKRSAMRRFRSLSILRPRAKQPKAETVAPPSAPHKPAPSSKPIAGASPTSTTPASAHSRAEICAATIAKRKRAKYAYVRPPPTLAQELAVMQFADGGKLETHIQRVMEEQARLAAGSRPGAQRGVADVYRDDKGGVWWDADEEMEYAHLLGGETVQDALRGDGHGDVEMQWEWEAFDAEAAEPLAPFLFHGGALRTAPLPAQNTGDDRRSSISSVDSDLDPQYLLPLPENEDPRAAVDDRVLASRRIGGASMSILSLPSRPRRAALHLTKPASFLVDAAFNGAGASRSPTWSAHENKENAQPSPASKPKPKGKARRRPAPLTLASSAHAGAAAATARRSASGPRARHHHRGAHAHGVHAAHTPAPPAGALPPVPAPAPERALLTVPGSAAAVAANVPTPMREFIEDSFAPVPALQSDSHSYIPPPTPTPSQAPSKIGFKSVKGLFGIGRKVSA